MTILDALKEPIFLLPKSNDKETFSILLSDIFRSFLATVDKVNEGTIVEKICQKRAVLQQFCESLIKSTNTYHEGFPAKAYVEFEEAMSSIDEFLFPENVGNRTIREFEPYYRARAGKNIQFERKEMFHIPFEKREYVSTQRFSMPGLPCLYLSNSIYVCWEELRRPDINKMQVSRMKLENYRLKFLDLSLTPTYLGKMLETFTKGDILKHTEKTHEKALDGWDVMTLNFLMVWPLVAACSIKVRKQDGAFKPEYIFPQFLLQWVTNNKNIDGIKYFSVEANISSKVDHSQLINYALPVKEIKPTGLCKTLTDSFSTTEAVSWEMLSLANPNITQHDQEKFKEVIRKLGWDNLSATLEFIKGKQILYWHTVFGKIEIELAEMPFEKI